MRVTLAVMVAPLLVGLTVRGQQRLTPAPMRIEKVN